MLRGMQRPSVGVVVSLLDVPRFGEFVGADGETAMRRYGDTPTRPHADTPIRRYADTGHRLTLGLLGVGDENKNRSSQRAGNSWDDCLDACDHSSRIV